MNIMEGHICIAYINGVSGQSEQKRGGVMILILVLGIPILGMMLYVNTVKLLKNLKEGNETANQTGWGAVLTGVILLLTLILIMSTHAS